MKSYSSLTAFAENLQVQRSIDVENLEVTPLSQQLMEAILRESAVYAQKTQQETATKTTVSLVQDIFQAAEKRYPDDIEFIDKLGDTMVYALFGKAAPPEIMDIIDNKRNAARQRQQQREAETHARALERQRASATVVQNNQNNWSEHSVTNEGQASIGGGTIQLAAAGGGA